MKQLHAIVKGKVQGVSFRHYTTLKARQLGLVGWVRNRSDETVEVMAEGDEEKLKSLASWLHHGSPDAEVDTVEITWDEPRGEFTNFKIAYELD
jgi:acylphosphatase